MDIQPYLYGKESGNQCAYRLNCTLCKSSEISKNTDDIEAIKKELEVWKARKEKEESLERNKTNSSIFNF